MYTIISNFGGYIRLESELGQGTSFFIYLPYSESLDVEQTEESPKSPNKQSNLEQKQYILIAEDDEQIQNLISKFLITQGYHIIRANNGLEALEIMSAKKEQIEFIISDVMMPNLTGPDLENKMRDKGVDVPILFISGYSWKQLTDQGIKINENLFLRKPFSTKILSELYLFN